jgi:hypothetical protein
MESKDTSAAAPAGVGMPKREIHIPLRSIHTCDRYCAMDAMTRNGTSGIAVFDSSTFDPNFKCEFDGKEDDTMIHIESMGRPEDENVLKADEVVIPDHRIKINFDYPLGNPAVFTFTSSTGFTRGQLIELIVSTYKRIYAEEEKSIQNAPVIPVEKRRPLLNRNQTDGKYAIYGHDLGDLYIEGITYYPDDRVVSLDIGS